jgi:hypothetical protein
MAFLSHLQSHNATQEHYFLMEQLIATSEGGGIEEREALETHLECSRQVCSEGVYILFLTFANRPKPSPKFTHTASTTQMLRKSRKDRDCLPRNLERYLLVTEE